MKTHDLIATLAANLQPTSPRAISRRLAWSVVIGVSAATLALLFTGGVRDDMHAALDMPRFWVKASFPAAVALAAWYLAGRLGRPGARTRRGWIMLSIPLVAVWCSAAYVVASAPSDVRMQLILGHTWRICTFNILALSLPTFMASFWAMRGLAPTRLRLAGAGAGLFAGAQAVLVYTLYCAEMSTPFWATWYVLGMMLPALAGALLGPRWLRW